MLFPPLMPPLKKMRFSKSYFTAYCGEGRYGEHFRSFSEIDTCCATIQNQRISVKKALVLGAATGEVLKEIHRELGVIPYGCEISRWAYNQIPIQYQRKIVCLDMNRYLKNLAKNGFECDLVFSNSLFYLNDDQLQDACLSLAKVSSFLHFHPIAEGDAWVQIQKPYPWWRKTFAKHGFVPTRSPYLWRNEGR